MITIKGNEYPYNETEVLNFAEGLIGMPDMRRAVLIPLDDCKPFCWLASIDDEKYRFIVVDPNEIFADYHPDAPSAAINAELKTLTIVKVCSDWTKTTVNLRAPIFINAETNSGMQSILSDNKYRLEEALPLN